MPISRILKIREGGLLFGDIFILYSSLVIMLAIRYGNISVDIPRGHFMPFSILFVAWILIFYIAGLYDLRSLNRTRAIEDRFWPAIAIAVLFSIVFFYFFYYAPGFGIAPKTNLFIFAAIAGSALYAWRSLWTVFIELRGGEKRILLIGSDEETAELSRHITANPQLGYTVGAWIEHESEASPEKVRNKILAERINLIVVPQNHQEHHQSWQRYTQLPAEVIDFVSMYEAVFRKIPLHTLEEARLFSELTTPHALYDRIKYLIEWILSLMLSIALFPLFLLIAIAIKISSPGSAFFTQIRVGQHGKHFVLWKFRTMVADAEKHGPAWSKPNDPRITPLGKFLRASHLDEIPQLWNILRGELSLIGPRPERPEFVAMLEKEIPLYHFRHIVRPGLTGWAQLYYRYAASSRETYEKLQYDLYYIRHRSFWLEMSTFLKTIKRFFVNAA